MSVSFAFPGAGRSFLAATLYDNAYDHGRGVPMAGGDQDTLVVADLPFHAYYPGGEPAVVVIPEPPSLGPGGGASSLLRRGLRPGQHIAPRPTGGFVLGGHAAPVLRHPDDDDEIFLLADDD